MMVRSVSLANRIISAWKRHGGTGCFVLLGKNISHYLGELLSGRLFGKAEEVRSEYDEAHGTDTERIREVGSLHIESENARHAVRYQPSPSNLARQVIHGLNIAHSQFTFLDFGAGKGRVLLLAAELPFHDVTGIEFSLELCEIANSNIARLSSQKRLAAHVECQHADATAFALPETPLVCYFYNPFDAVIMQSVADRLSASLAAHPREIHVIYLHPEHRAIFEASGRWDVSDEGPFHIVYRARSPEALPQAI